MRKALGLLLVLPLLAQAKVEDRPLITNQLLTERWVKAWNKSDEGLSGELLERRTALLRLVHNHLTTADGAQGVLLLHELPDSEFSEAITDLVKTNSGTMREMSLEQFFMTLALEGDLIYQRGLNLSESGVTLEAMKGALGVYLKNYKETELVTTVLKINLEDLRLASEVAPEYLLILKYLPTMLRQKKILNFRVVVTTSPEAFEYVFDTDELMYPIFDLEDHEALQMIDGKKLDFGMTCASLFEQLH